MNKSAIQILIIVLTALAVKPYASAAELNDASLTSRIDRLLSSFNIQPNIAIQGKPAHSMLTGSGIRIENCKNYPYHNQRSPAQGYIILANDIREGLRIGLQSLAGNGPMGPLHPYHHKQAALLLDILESSKQKVFRCVEDKTFAYAVAKPPPELFKEYDNDKVIRDIPYPGVAIDTYRLSGFLTRKHEPSIYRDFFKLDDHQIAEHLGGNPQRMERLHRYKNLKALVFHEMVHWLGHAHTNMRPDVVDLYEICFFGGSDFISDADSNRKFQQRACSVLQDSELWDADEKQQARLWHKKGYDQLKPDMRKMYD
jgi:hypothetical protein